MKSYFTYFKGADNEFYFNLKASNHEIILQSEGYKTQQGAINGISSVQVNCNEDSKYERKLSKSIN